MGFFFQFNPVLLSPLLLLQSNPGLGSQPNFLYILADDLGWADVSWNNPDSLTPVLEGLAKEGVILNRFYTQPKCSPSRASLMTGLYPYKMSMQRGSIGPFRPTGLPTHLPTLPGLLRDAGYSTHLVGKWHLGYCHTDYTPNRRGFDTFFGEYAQQADHYTREHEINSHIGSGYDLWRNDNVTRDGEGLYSTFLWEEETSRLLTSLAAANSSKPWYVQLSFTAVHPPYQAPKKFLRLHTQKGRSYTKEEYDLEVVRKAMVSTIDESVGRIIKTLKANGLYKNTLIVFTSDNGSGYRPANLPLRGKKGSVFEGGVRVPAFLHGVPLAKATLTRPHTSDALAHITDWLPTLLGLAGAPPTIPTDGFDLWPALTQGSISPRTSLVYNIDMDDQSGTFQIAIRHHQWKLIWGQTKEFRPHKKQEGELHLFNLDMDPNEEVDLAIEKEQKLNQMKELAREWAADLKVAFQPNRFSLGYPRYHNGLLEPGWCKPGWWQILWKPENFVPFLARI